MNVIISARHMQLTEAMKNSVHKSLDRIKHEQLVHKAEVVLDSDHNKFNAEITLSGKSVHLDAKAECDNMYKAIEEVMTKLQKQLDKKHDQRHSKGASLSEMEIESVAEAE